MDGCEQLNIDSTCKIIGLASFGALRKTMDSDSLKAKLIFLD